MSTRIAVLKLLADGKFHSGTDMGATLGVSRAAVCKNVNALTRAGLTIHRVSGRGYRMDKPCRPLDRRAILKHLRELGVRKPALLLLDEVGSTSSCLLQRAQQEDISGRVCLAEAQKRGRGRRGRAWVSTPYRNLLLSMAWRFQSGPALVAGLSLAAGVALVHALREYGVEDVGLKWPNDLLWRDHAAPARRVDAGGRKLGGILIDVQGEAAGPCLVVLGVGINGEISPREAQDIDQPWVDLQGITGTPVDRNRLAGLVIVHLERMFRAFERDGLQRFRDEWERLHHYSGKRVRLVRAGGSLTGRVEGIDATGALLLRDAHGRLRTCHSGELSLRPYA